MNQLTRITREIITAHFPELKGIRVDASYKRLKNCYLQWGKYYRGGYCIEADSSLKRVSLIVLSGGLSHELMHIVDCFNSPVAYTLNELLYVWKRYEAFKERRTDISAVQRGLVRELLAFSEWRDKRKKARGEKVGPESGLTTQELEKLVLKV